MHIQLEADTPLQAVTPLTAATPLQRQGHKTENYSWELMDVDIHTTVSENKRGRWRR